MLVDQCDRCGVEDLLGPIPTGYGDYEYICSSCAYDDNMRKEGERS